MHLVAQPHTAVGAKQEVNRHWLTAGAVLASAAVIAAAPGIAPVPAGVQHDIQAGAVRLTAGWDPFAPLQAAFDTAKASGTILADNFLLAPGVGLQQAIANQLGYAKQLFDDPSSFEAVSQQFAANVMKVATGLTLIGADEATKDAVLKHTLGGLHGMALDMFPSFLAEGGDVDTFSAVMGILASPLSGVLIGSIGPVVSPAVALLNSAVAISNALQAGDSTTALSSLLGVPAGMVDAFLNGANLNLDALAPMINSAGLIKDGVTIDGLNIAFGGLLTTGSTDRSTYEYTDEDGNKVTIPSVGGSIFNSLGLDVKLGAIGISVKGEAVGPIGALQGLSQTVGVLLGSGWDDWDGKGNAPAPKPPLFGLQPLATGDVLSDTAESAGVTKLRDMLKTAAVNDIVKKLQGLTAGTEAAADSATAVAATVDGTDTAASTGVAAATELTHATTNKMVAVSVEKPSAPAPAEDATTTPTAEETGATGEKAGAPTESADDATAAGKTMPKAQTGAKAPKTRAATTTDKTPRSNLVKGVKDAVKNVRNGLGANSSRKSGESTSSSSGSSTGSDSPAKKDAGSKSKHDDKK
ncbi:outer membrane porin GjpA [Mycolicibacterium septicum]|uniref:outer membrane porin GjpA n=1 Tax=Mycolicibacterium septicum TaxID=98668 RepID=UPI001AF26114|nr:outer membrane porin GjpA [Mycolicibacterium septicum]QRY54328.1 outer membrane porin GjpA [Mycolicibacterium septicum]